MSVRPAPAWLVDFQKSFGAMVRTPLDRGSGTLRARSTNYPPELERRTLPGPDAGGRRLSSAETLAVYNRQYWFRLFGIVAGAFPLTARLLGHWRFNGFVARWLGDHPPRHWNIDRVPDGFEDFLAHSSAEDVESGLGVDRAALLEAARIDETWRTIHRAALVPGWRLPHADGERLAAGRLRASPAVRFIEESWPLVDLRGRVVEEDGEQPVPLPPRLARVQSWAIVRRKAGVGALPLDPLEARLFALLREHPVGDALAMLETSCPDDDRTTLPAKARGWLARSVELDFWTGLDDPTSVVDP